jgi:hypothetical protein
MDNPNSFKVQFFFDYPKRSPNVRTKFGHILVTYGQAHTIYQVHPTRPRRGCSRISNVLVPLEITEVLTEFAQNIGNCLDSKQRSGCPRLNPRVIVRPPYLPETGPYAIGRFLAAPASTTQNPKLHGPRTGSSHESSPANPHTPLLAWSSEPVMAQSPKSFFRKQRTISSPS